MDGVAGLTAKPQAALLQESQFDAEIHNLQDGAQKFEALFATMLVQQVTQPSEFGDGLMGSGPGAEVLRGIVEDIVGQQLSRAGSLGIAQTLEKSLSPESFGLGTGTKINARGQHS